ncbi:hypothetical protein PTSG_03606 [Salpingoeca rosetta]|uniref:Uncharacterized protein n=1 Tax=Salpingoeca rosetta (strain ATCC 50818 / BSB-021) TaxID=946362 RepID=F2U629_SALR5|nr:uncharacterized protein PTSG_03606 [Salpingoeca rosetta]EGD82970.1 hypothetical protein PTSG_03606 [Salpingoeca rosetta]|eukprot:XP_004995334.1 hypothetical protein PTSG_03606 [Salpingoeca rosetta]
MVLLLLLLPQQRALAASVALLNPSFEEDALSDGATSNTVTGWSVTDAGVLNPLSQDLPQVPDGSNVLVVQQQGEAALAVVQTIDQGDTISVTVQATARTMVAGALPASVTIAHPSTGATLASSDITEGDVMAGTFSTFTVSYEAMEALSGFQIVLACNSQADGSQLAFDDVQANVTAPALSCDLTIPTSTDIGGDCYATFADETACTEWADGLVQYADSQGRFISASCPNTGFPSFRVHVSQGCNDLPGITSNLPCGNGMPDCQSNTFLILADYEDCDCFWEALTREICHAMPETTACGLHYNNHDYDPADNDNDHHNAANYNHNYNNHNFHHR